MERWNIGKEGCVFIDRDAKHFDKILNFLRDGKISRHNTSEDLEEIKREAEFYCISGLSKCLEECQKMEDFGQHTIIVQAIKRNLITQEFDYLRINTSETEVEVPLMADDTVSLKVLRKIFKGAECVLQWNQNVYPNGQRLKML